MNKQKDRRNGFYFIDKSPYPSVTNILSVIAKPELIHWAGKTAARAALANPDLTEQEAVALIYTKRDKAGDLGRTVHSFVEALKNGAEIDLNGVENEHIPYCKAFNKFISEHPFKFIENERTVFHQKHRYAGTLDILASDKDGNLWVLDVKTSGGVYPEYGLQLVAYAEALKEKTGKNYRMGIIHLRPDETYAFSETNEPFDAFLACKKLWEWKEKDKIEEINKFIELGNA